MNEDFKEFLTKNVFSPAAGFTWTDWLGILAAHRFRVSPRYWPRALFISLNSIANSQASRREEREYAARLTTVEIPPPIFVLGHWRSGTTHLHNLLSRDPQFAYPTFYQSTQPHTFLTTEERASESKLLQSLSPKTRLIDNMEASFGAPMEDEVALCIMTGLSPVMGWLFPRHIERYERYLTFKDVPIAEVERWKAGFQRFLRKLTLKYSRPVILKSPPHTARIRLLLELFPDARFVHIHRHPYEVFRSYQRSAQIMRQMLQVQVPAGIDFDEQAIRQYRVMYDAFFAQKDLIPAGRFIDIAYEELERDPLGQLEAVYRGLGLDGFEQARPLIERYLASIASYSKSTLPQIESALRSRIDSAWKQSFDAWGYHQ